MLQSSSRSGCMRWVCKVHSIHINLWNNCVQDNIANQGCRHELKFGGGLSFKRNPACEACYFLEYIVMWDYWLQAKSCHSPELQCQTLSTEYWSATPTSCSVFWWPLYFNYYVVQWYHFFLPPSCQGWPLFRSLSWMTTMPTWSLILSATWPLLSTPQTLRLWR